MKYPSSCALCALPLVTSHFFLNDETDLQEINIHAMVGKTKLKYQSNAEHSIKKQQIPLENRNEHVPL